MDLEPKYPRSIPLRLKCDSRRAKLLSNIISRQFRFLPHPSCPPLHVVATTVASYRQTDVYGAALGWNKCWVDEEKEMGEGSSEVGTVDRAMSGGFRGIDVFAAATV